jgi:hypothetical protein
MRSLRPLILMLPLLWACGGVSVVLKSPVESKCASAGLKGCPELTDGVLLFVEGKKDEGKVKLEQAAGANAPAKVKKFAKLIKQLNKVPGTGPYMKHVNEVADILLVSVKAKGRAGAGAGPDDADDMVEDTAEDRYGRPPPPPPPRYR